MRLWWPINRCVQWICTWSQSNGRRVCVMSRNIYAYECRYQLSHCESNTTTSWSEQIAMCGLFPWHKYETSFFSVLSSLSLWYAEIIPPLNEVTTMILPWPIFFSIKRAIWLYTIEDLSWFFKVYYNGQTMESTEYENESSWWLDWCIVRLSLETEAISHAIPNYCCLDSWVCIYIWDDIQSFFILHFV